MKNHYKQKKNILKQNSSEVRKSQTYRYTFLVNRENQIWNEHTYIEFVSLHNLGRRIVNVVMRLIVLVPFKPLKESNSERKTVKHQLKKYQLSK